MDDREIIELYWSRSEAAIGETAGKYGGYCSRIAYNILQSREDTEECVNDTYVNAWNAMPPHRPACLRTFLGRITRNLALQRRTKYAAQKRGGGEVALSLDELAEVLPGGNSPEQAAEDGVIAEVIERFLRGLPKEQRAAFVLRYFYLLPVKDVAKKLGMGESRVKAILFRARGRLREQLTKEGIAI